MAQGKRVAALGFFDGVHLGHAQLMYTVTRRSAEIKGSSAVISFDVHPDNLVFGREVPLINSIYDRKDIIRREFGIDEVIFLHFNRSLMRMPWRDFADSLISELNIGWIVVGHDFCFGYRGEGTALRLREYCAERGVGCDVINAVSVDGRVVSSTYIRELIGCGDMEGARGYLGHPHCLTDEVRQGLHLGAKLGSPTINMCFGPGVIVPQHGVYATKACLEDGSEHIAVTNVGLRPTVGENDTVTVESHLLDYSGDLYGAKVRIEFYSFIRHEKRFEDFAALSERIRLDAQQTKEFFDKKA